MDNVVVLPGVDPAAIGAVAPSIRIPLDDVGAAHDALTHIEAAAGLGLASLAKAAQYGDAAALDGVRQVFAALARLLNE